ncbi:MAG: alpha/beta fold hydrolase [Gemmatimonadota bacterium]
MIAILPGGVEIAYDDVGGGVPILFIHGWPHNRTLWSAQLSGLRTLARCVAPDLRGFGGSSVAPPWSIDQYADDLAAFLTTLGIERAVVCGLSMGGYIAMSMLRRHRDRIRALIFTSTRATADTPEAREMRLRLIAFVEERGVEALAGKQLRAMVGSTTFDSRADVLERLRSLMADAPADGVTGALRAMAERRDSTDLLAGIEFPTLVVSGAEDTFTVPEELRALAAAIPNCTLEVLERAGHACAFERPAAFNHVVGEFLARLVYD